jgi:hypothetical protein
MEAKPWKIPHPFRKLNKELIDKIVDKIGRGSTHRLACLSSGITTRCFDMWIKQGECDLDYNVESLCTYLVLSLSSVKEIEVMRCRKNAEESEKGHRGAEWTLEHAYMRDFSTHSAIQELAQDINDLRAEFLKGKDNGKGLDKEGSEA